MLNIETRRYSNKDADKAYSHRERNAGAKFWGGIGSGRGKGVAKIAQIARGAKLLGGF